MELNNYNMCGSKKCLYKIKDDEFCKNIINDLYYENEINDCNFVGGTIFCKRKSWKCII